MRTKRQWGYLAATVLLGALLVGFGVAPFELLLFAAYQLAFVVAPGCLVVIALTRDPAGPVRTLAIGAGLGYALSVLAFIATAALGARGLYLIYPPIAASASVAVLILRGRLPALVSALRASAAPGRVRDAFSALLVFALACFCLTYFTATPLPGEGNFSYFPDYVWHIALAADALHHWPLTDPHSAGTPLSFHYFVHVQMAATAQVTGLDLPLVLFRLSPPALFALLVVQVAALARMVTGGYGAALGAVAILMLLGDLQMDPSAAELAHYPFLGLFFFFLYASPSQLFGLVMFVPLVMLLCEIVSTAGRDRRWGRWALLGLFGVGASLAKVMVLPLTIAGLGTYCVWWGTRERSLPARPLLAAGLLSGILGLIYLDQLRGHSGDFVLDPFTTFSQMPAVLTVKGYLTGVLPSFPLEVPLLDAAGVLVGFIGLMAAPLVGIGWLLSRRGVDLDERRALLASLFAVGMAGWVMLGAPGSNNQTYFLFIGFVPGSVLAAEGLVAAWRARPTMTEATARRIGLIAVIWVGCLAALIAAPAALGLFDDSDAAAQDAKSLLLWYGGLTMLIGALALALRHLARQPWRATAAACTAAVLLVAALDVPFAFLAPPLLGRDAARPERPLSPGLYAGFSWIRENVPFDATLAVNTDSIAEFAPAAFAEHRMFVEGWLYSTASVDAGYEEVVNGEVNPFSSRLAVNRKAFTSADPEALRAMRDDFGVSYLLIDRVNGYGSDEGELRRRFPVAYENDDLLVLRIGRGGSP